MTNNFTLADVIPLLADNSSDQMNSADKCSFAILTETVQKQILSIRLVNKCIKHAVEMNANLIVEICVSEAGTEELQSEFLIRWKGVMHLSSKTKWLPDKPWFREFKSAVACGRLRVPRKLALVVEGDALHMLTQALANIEPRIEQLSVSFRGSSSELLAATTALPALGGAVTMDVSVVGPDLPCTQAISLDKMIDYAYSFNWPISY